MDNFHILIVEDEPKIAIMVKEYFEVKGFTCSLVATGEQGVARLRQSPVDLILLDWMLPGISGLESVKRIREFTDIPLIMLTARDAEGDKVLGLESGADDYITKPFSLKELAARVSAQLRRYRRSEARTDKSGELVLPPFRLNHRSRQVWRGQQRIELTAMRFELFALFLENPGVVFTREQIMNHLSGDGFYEGFDRTIDAHIKNLRKSIEELPAAPRYIRTVRGIGYTFHVD